MIEIDNILDVEKYLDGIDVVIFDCYVCDVIFEYLCNISSNFFSVLLSLLLYLFLYSVKSV